MNTTELEKLIDELHEASELYYQKLTTSTLSDEEFDAKVAYLGTLKDSGSYPDHFTEGSRGYLLIEGSPSLGTEVTAPVDKIIRHKVPMLSLDKAKTEEALKNYLEKAINAGSEGFQLQAKIDGFALTGTYEDGVLTTLATRGNGTQGEDLSYLINHRELAIVGLPSTIPNNEDVEVRGELYLTDAQYIQADQARLASFSGQPYNLNRNALVGLVKKAGHGLGYQAAVSFAAYSIIKDREPADMGATPAGVATINELTTLLAPTLKLSGLTTVDEVVAATNDFGRARANFIVPTDGLVIKPLNEAAMHKAMGYSTSHPKSQIAFKFPAPTAVTELLAIDLTVGKTGKVTPVGRVKTVKLDGSYISNLSLHNLNLVHTKNIRVGQTILIEKANEIIPQIKAVISTPADAQLITVPTNCPVCTTKLESGSKEEGVWPPKTLRCPNQSCPSRDFFALKTAVGKNYLDIDGLSVKLLTSLNDDGRVTTIADLYSLTLEELSEATFGTNAQDGTPIKTGVKRAQNIIDHIEASKTLPLTRILASLSITGLGNTMAKMLMAEFKTFDALQAASIPQVAAIKKMGEVRARTVVEGLVHRAGLIQQLRDHGVTFAMEEVSGGTHLKGNSYSISGAVPEPFANRGAWIEYIEANGGAFHSAPKADTTHMVGDEGDSSSKVVKALKYKAAGTLTFITPEEFTTQFVK